MPFFSHKRSVVLFVIIIGVLIWNHNRPPDQVPTQETRRPVPKVEASSSPPSGSVSPAVVETPAAPVPPVATPPATVPATAAPTSALVRPSLSTDSPATSVDIGEDLSAVDSTIRNFRAVLGENPIGSNAEITGALLGNNLKQIKLEMPAGSRLNSEGEMCDRWGTPYFFHQVSGTEMEIRSAGPDQIMWTGDDAHL
jgi:hypothetical protein